MKKILVVVGLLVGLVACTDTTVVPKQKSNLSVGMAKTKLVEGKTNQTEVIELFGSPNLITTNSEGNEVWTYNKSSYDSSSSAKESGWSFLLVGGSKSSVLSNSTTSSLDLIITFDKRGIVQKYKVISASY